MATVSPLAKERLDKASPNKLGYNSHSRGCCGTKGSWCVAEATSSLSLLPLPDSAFSAPLLPRAHSEEFPISGSASGGRDLRQHTSTTRNLVFSTESGPLPPVKIPPTLTPITGPRSSVSSARVLEPQGDGSADSSPTIMQKPSEAGSGAPVLDPR